MGWSFFGLSSNYRQILIEEFYFINRFITLSFDDFNKIPTFQRKYMINRIIDDNTPKDS